MLRRRRGRRPGLEVVQGTRVRCVVACRGGDIDAGSVRVEEGQRGRFGPGRGAAGDRIVDDVDTIGDGLVDGRHGRDVRAQDRAFLKVGVAGVIRHQAGPWRDAGDAQGCVVDHHVPAVAGGDGSGMAAVAVGVAKAGLFAHVGHAALVARRRADEVVATDQLVVAASGVIAARQAGAQVHAGTQRVDVDVAVHGVGGGKRRAAEIDARIDHADDDAFALHRRGAAREAGRTGPGLRGSDQGRAHVGVRRVLAIALDQRHAGHRGDKLRFLRGQVHDDAVHCMLHAVPHLELAAGDAGHLLLHQQLAALQVAQIVLRVDALPVESRLAAGVQVARRHGDAGGAALIGCQCRLVEQHDERAGRALFHRIQRRRRRVHAVAAVEPGVVVEATARKAVARHHANPWFAGLAAVARVTTRRCAIRGTFLAVPACRDDTGTWHAPGAFDLAPRAAFGAIRRGCAADQKLVGRGSGRGNERHEHQRGAPILCVRHLHP